MSKISELYTYINVWGHIHSRAHISKSQNNSMDLISPSTFMWVQEKELRLPGLGLHSKHFYLQSHLASPTFTIDSSKTQQQLECSSLREWVKLQSVPGPIWKTILYFSSNNMKRSTKYCQAERSALQNKYKHRAQAYQG